MNLFKFLLVPLCLLSVGCALIAGGTKDPITFMSEPSGATVVIDGMPRGTTPVALELETEEHSVDIKKDGYKPHHFYVSTSFDWWTVGNVVSWWLIGIVVDLVSDAAYDFTEDSYFVQLKPETAEE